LTEKGCRILVATRRSAADRGVENLIESLGPAHVHSLNNEPSTEEDIAGYVRRRLLGSPGSPYADSPNVATAVSAVLAQRADGKIPLYADHDDGIVASGTSILGVASIAYSGNAHLGVTAPVPVDDEHCLISGVINVDQYT